MRKEKPLFSIADYKGRIVKLIKGVWTHKIIKYHPEVALGLEEVKKAIADPLVVVRSMAKEESELFYIDIQDSLGKPYLLVVVDYKVPKSKEGIIVTTYRTNKIQKGEILWRRKGK
ncbi:MAG TPA: hypothetical protein EYP21_10765 [Syntrophaceae bacterium]|nr:hypothetical protein [Syntrophaceae bacterium]